MHYEDEENVTGKVAAWLSTWVSIHFELVFPVDKETKVWLFLKRPFAAFKQMTCLLGTLLESTRLGFIFINILALAADSFGIR